MVRKVLRVAFVACTLNCLMLFATQAGAAHPDVFYNYYNGPTVYGQGTPAQLYVSPRPTPPLVGHTWISYPPLNPHEFLYHHHRKHYKYHPEGGHTISTVKYKSHWLW